jgi:hypothetical protein
VNVSECHHACALFDSVSLLLDGSVQLNISYYGKCLKQCSWERQIPWRVREVGHDALLLPAALVLPLGGDQGDDDKNKDDKSKGGGHRSSPAEGLGFRFRV